MKKTIISISFIIVISLLLSSCACVFPFESFIGEESTTDTFAESDKVTDVETTEDTTFIESESIFCGDEPTSESQNETSSTHESDSQSEFDSDTEVETHCEHEYLYPCSVVCNKCGEDIPSQGDHSFSDIDACEDQFCTYCGDVLDLDHEWVIISPDSATFSHGGEYIEQCKKCSETVTHPTDAVDPTSLGMPIVYIEDLDGAAIPLTELEKADGEITVKYSYVGPDASSPIFDCFCAIKVQGATSSAYPKKNYNIKLFEDEGLLTKFKVNFGWGKENKYTMKANYIDASQARNIVAAKLFAQVVATRDNIAEGLRGAPNYGVIDGYPILIFINGEFHGLYTMNIPKDNWAFGMSSSSTEKQALLMADSWTNSVNLRETIGDGAFADYGWEVEHSSTTDETWIKDSFNELINLLNCGDNAKIKAELSDHLDIEAAIDNMIFTYYINAADNVAKNILWATYDGKVWIPSMYDMDGTFGIYWDGQAVPPNADGSGSPKNTYPSINSNGSLKIPGSKLYSILIKCFPDEVEARYRDLRKTVLNIKNTRVVFGEFFALAPLAAYNSDYEKWESLPGTDTNKDNMYDATISQIQRLDDFFLNFNK